METGGEASAGPAGLRHVASHTGLRGIAALLVVFYHYQYGATFRLPIETATSLLARGYLWVDLFFVLSGFIISYTGAADREAPFRMSETKRFLVARLARIYPLHLFCLAYFAVFLTVVDLGFAAIDKPPPYAAWSGDGAKAFVAQLFLVQAWLPLDTAWNIPSWSISAELFAYMLFPLLVGLQCRAKLPGRAFLLLLPIAFYSYVGILGGGSLDIVSVLAPWRCLAGFSLGILVFYYRDRIEALPSPILSLCQVVAVVWIIWNLSGQASDVAIVPAFVLLVSSTWPDRGIIAWLLGTRPCRFLGAISYSVYLNHVCLITIFAFFWGRLAAKLPGADPSTLRIVELSLLTAIIIFCSMWTFRYVEAPARTWVTTRLLGRKPVVRPDIPVAP